MSNHKIRKRCQDCVNCSLALPEYQKKAHTKYICKYVAAGYFKIVTNGIKHTNIFDGTTVNGCPYFSRR